MIPYEELVAALSRWRARQGLPTDYLGESAPAPAYEMAPAPDHSHEDVLEIGDELLEESHAHGFGAYGRDAQQDERFPELGDEFSQQASIEEVPAAPSTPDARPQGRNRRGTGRRRRK